MGSTLWSLSCVYASTETQGQELQTMSACVTGLLKKKTKKKTNQNVFGNGKLYLGDELLWDE